MLKIEHISKTFNPGTVNEKQAIKDLSLNLEKGDFATIIGSNGAGKSTLFNAICGDFLTDSGMIMLDGQDITFMPQHVRAKTIGRLYQRTWHLQQEREDGSPMCPDRRKSIFMKN